MNLDSDPDPDRDNFRMIRNRYTLTEIISV